MGRVARAPSCPRKFSPAEQARAFDPIVRGRSFVGRSKTGSGKTIACADHGRGPAGRPCSGISSVPAEHRVCSEGGPRAF